MEIHKQERDAKSLRSFQAFDSLVGFSEPSADSFEGSYGGTLAVMPKSLEISYRLGFP